MLVEKLHPYTGKYNVMDLDITEEQLREFQSPNSKRRSIQEIMPQLNADEREFLISGLRVGEFDDLFPNEEDI